MMWCSEGTGSGVWDCNGDCSGGRSVVHLLLIALEWRAMVYEHGSVTLEGSVFIEDVLMRQLRHDGSLGESCCV